MKTDCKSQVTVNGKGEVVGVIVAAQHAEVTGTDNDKKAAEREEMERAVIGQAIQPVIFPNLSSTNSLTIDKIVEEFGTGKKKEIRRHYFIKELRIFRSGSG